MHWKRLLALRDQVGGTVTVLTMGPPQAEHVLQYAVSMGADDVYLATDRAFGGADTLATSYTLAAAIRKLGSFDLIFCGTGVPGQQHGPDRTGSRCNAQHA